MRVSSSGMGSLVKKVKGLVWEKPYGQTVKLSLVAVLNISWAMSVINKGTDSGKPCGVFLTCVYWGVQSLASWLVAKLKKRVSCSLLTKFDQLGTFFQMFKGTFVPGGDRQFQEQTVPLDRIFRHKVSAVHVFFGTKCLPDSLGLVTKRVLTPAASTQRPSRRRGWGSGNSAPAECFSRRTIDFLCNRAHSRRGNAKIKALAEFRLPFQPLEIPHFTTEHAPDPQFPNRVPVFMYGAATLRHHETSVNIDPITRKSCMWLRR